MDRDSSLLSLRGGKIPSRKAERFIPRYKAILSATNCATNYDKHLDKNNWFCH